MKKRNWILIFGFAVLAIACLIFFFASQDGAASSRTSEGLARLLLRWTRPGFDALTAKEQTKLLDAMQVAVRKAAHFIEFAALGFFLHLHVFAWYRLVRRVVSKRDSSSRRFRLPWWIWSLPIGCLYAVTDEIHQGFVADRAPRIADVGVDTVGVIAGMSVCALMLWLVVRLHRRKKERTG